MPELIEVEAYRQAAAPTIGRQITAVDLLDPDYVKRVPNEMLIDSLLAERIESTRRIGKLMLLDISNGASVGLRFGMTGRLIVDGAAPIDRLVYGSNNPDPKWNRFGIGFAAGSMVIHDPRRLGSVELDPDESKLGVDAATIGTDDLAAAIARSRAPIKSRLMDQSRIAGLGNLLTDEILWRSGLDPLRPAGELSESEIDRLADAIVTTIDELTKRGGSHRGTLQDQREPSQVDAGFCPADGERLRRDRVGGRTTVWCPAHQR